MTVAAVFKEVAALIPFCNSSVDGSRRVVLVVKWINTGYSSHWADVYSLDLMFRFGLEFKRLKIAIWLYRLRAIGCYAKIGTSPH